MTQPKIDHYEAVRGPSDKPGTGPDDSIQLVVIDGRQYLQFAVRPGDVQPWDRGEGNRGSNGQFNERAEVSLAPAQGTLKYQSQYNVREGMLQTYDLDYYFRAGFPNHVSAQHQWAVIGQIGHPQDTPAPNLSVPRFSGITCHDNEIHLAVHGGTDYFAREPMRTNVRLPRRLVVKWASAADGYVKWVDRSTAAANQTIDGKTGQLIGGTIIGQYNGPTIPAGEYQYILWGYYRAGGLPPGTVCIGGPNGPWIEITDGDLTETAPTAKRNSAPLDPGKPSVQPNDGAAALMAIRDQLVALKDPKVQPQIDAANKLLDAGGWTP